MESSHNGTLSSRPPLAAPAHRSRWERWQHSPIAQRYLTPEGRAADCTVLTITPSMRPAFFDLVALLLARARLEPRLATVLEAQDPAATAALQDTLAAWRAWRRYTVQLARAFERQAHGQQATLPPVPPALQALAAAFDVVVGDDDEERTV